MDMDAMLVEDFGFNDFADFDALINQFNLRSLSRESSAEGKLNDYRETILFLKVSAVTGLPVKNRFCSCFKEKYLCTVEIENVKQSIELATGNSKDNLVVHLPREHGSSDMVTGSSNGSNVDNGRNTGSHRSGTSVATSGNEPWSWNIIELYGPTHIKFTIMRKIGYKYTTFAGKTTTIAALMRSQIQNNNKPTEQHTSASPAATTATRNGSADHMPRWMVTERIDIKDPTVSNNNSSNEGPPSSSKPGWFNSHRPIISAKPQSAILYRGTDTSLESTERFNGSRTATPRAPDVESSVEPSFSNITIWFEFRLVEINRCVAVQKFRTPFSILHYHHHFTDGGSDAASSSDAHEFPVHGTNNDSAHAFTSPLASIQDDLLVDGDNNDGNNADTSSSGKNKIVAAPFKQSEFHLLCECASAQVVIDVMKRLAVLKALQNAMILKTSLGHNALSVALLAGNASVVLALLQRAGNFCMKGLFKDSANPLHFAVMGNSTECLSHVTKFIKIYCEGEARPHVPTIRGSKPFSELIEWHDDHGLTPLALACKLGYTKMVDQLIKSGANCAGTTSLTTGSLTPLMIACTLGFEDIVQLLLVPLNALSISFMDSPFFSLGGGGSSDSRSSVLTQHLRSSARIRQGDHPSRVRRHLCDPGRKDTHRERTALHMAVAACQHKIVQRLLETGCSCLDTDNLGDTVFHCCAKTSCSAEIARSIVANESTNWKLYIQSSIEGGKSMETMLYRKRGLLCKNFSGRSAIECAVESGNLCIARYFVVAATRIYGEDSIFRHKKQNDFERELLRVRTATTAASSSSVVSIATNNATVGGATSESSHLPDHRDAGEEEEEEEKRRSRKEEEEAAGVVLRLPEKFLLSKSDSLRHTQSTVAASEDPQSPRDEKIEYECSGRIIDRSNRGDSICSSGNSSLFASGSSSKKLSSSSVYADSKEMKDVTVDVVGQTSNASTTEREEKEGVCHDTSDKKKAFTTRVNSARDLSTQATSTDATSDDMLVLLFGDNCSSSNNTTSSSRDVSRIKRGGGEKKEMTTNDRDSSYSASSDSAVEAVSDTVFKNWFRRITNRREQEELAARTPNNSPLPSSRGAAGQIFAGDSASNSDCASSASDLPSPHISLDTELSSLTAPVVRTSTALLAAPAVVVGSEEEDMDSSGSLCLVIPDDVADEEEYRLALTPLALKKYLGNGDRS